MKKLRAALRVEICLSLMGTLIFSVSLIFGQTANMDSGAIPCGAIPDAEVFLGEDTVVSGMPGEVLGLGRPDHTEGLFFLWFDEERQHFLEGPSVSLRVPSSPTTYRLLISDQCDQVSVAKVAVQVQAPFACDFRKIGSFICAYPVVAPPEVQALEGIPPLYAQRLEAADEVGISVFDADVPQFNSLYHFTWETPAAKNSPVSNCIRIGDSGDRVEVVQISDGVNTVRDSIYTVPQKGIFGDIETLLVPRSVKKGDSIRIWAKGAVPNQEQAYNITGLAFQIENEEGEIVASGVWCDLLGFTNGELWLDGFNMNDLLAEPGIYTVHLQAENKGTFPGQLPDLEIEYLPKKRRFFICRLFHKPSPKGTMINSFEIKIK